MSDMSRAVVRARNALAPFGGDEITEAIILLDRWLVRQDEATKRRLATYFGVAELPVSARPSEASHADAYSQRGLGYQSGEPAGAVNSGSAPANAATTPGPCVFPRCVKGEQPSYCGHDCDVREKPYEHEYGTPADGLAARGYTQADREKDTISPAKQAASAAMTPKKALRTQYGQGLADGFRITLRLFLGEPQAGAAPYTGPRTPESEAWARAALNRDPEALS